jgi:hypothetical protein
MTFVGRVHNPKIMLGILVTRADWSLPLDGYNWRDIAPWIFRRRLSLMSGSSEDDLLLVAPALLRQALSYLVGGASDGAFDERFFTTQRMRPWTRTIRDTQGHEFNDKVAAALRDLGWHAEVGRRLSSILNRRISADLGDVDVISLAER